MWLPARLTNAWQDVWHKRRHDLRSRTSDLQKSFLKQWIDDEISRDNDLAHKLTELDTSVNEFFAVALKRDDELAKACFTHLDTAIESLDTRQRQRDAEAEALIKRIEGEMMDMESQCTKRFGASQTRRISVAEESRKGLERQLQVHSQARSARFQVYVKQELEEWKLCEREINDRYREMIQQGGPRIIQPVHVASNEQEPSPVSSHKLQQQTYITNKQTTNEESESRSMNYMKKPVRMQSLDGVLSSLVSDNALTSQGHADAEFTSPLPGTYATPGETAEPHPIAVPSSPVSSMIPESLLRERREGKKRDPNPSASPFSDVATLPGSASPPSSPVLPVPPGEANRAAQEVELRRYERLKSAGVNTVDSDPDLSRAIYESLQPMNGGSVPMHLPMGPPPPFRKIVMTSPSRPTRPMQSGVGSTAVTGPSNARKQAAEDTNIRGFSNDTAAQQEYLESVKINTASRVQLGQVGVAPGQPQQASQPPHLTTVPSAPAVIPAVQEEQTYKPRLRRIPAMLFSRLQMERRVPMKGADMAAVQVPQKNAIAVMSEGSLELIGASAQERLWEDAKAHSRPGDKSEVKPVIGQDVETRTNRPEGADLRVRECSILKQEKVVHAPQASYSPPIEEICVNRPATAIHASPGVVVPPHKGAKRPPPTEPQSQIPVDSIATADSTSALPTFTSQGPDHTCTPCITDGLLTQSPTPMSPELKSCSSRTRSTSSWSIRRSKRKAKAWVNRNVNVKLVQGLRQNSGSGKSGEPTSCELSPDIPPDWTPREFTNPPEDSESPVIPDTTPVELHNREHLTLRDHHARPCPHWMPEWLIIELFGIWSQSSKKLSNGRPVYSFDDLLLAFERGSLKNAVARTEKFESAQSRHFPLRDKISMSQLAHKLTWDARFDTMMAASDTEFSEKLVILDQRAAQVHDRLESVPFAHADLAELADKELDHKLQRALDLEREEMNRCHSNATSRLERFKQNIQEFLPPTVLQITPKRTEGFCKEEPLKSQIGNFGGFDTTPTNSYPSRAMSPEDNGCGPIKEVDQPQISGHQPFNYPLNWVMDKNPNTIQDYFLRRRFKKLQKRCQKFEKEHQEKRQKRFNELQARASGELPQCSAQKRVEVEELASHWFEWARTRNTERDQIHRGALRRIERDAVGNKAEMERAFARLEKETHEESLQRDARRARWVSVLTEEIYRETDVTHAERLQEGHNTHTRIMELIEALGRGHSKEKGHETKTLKNRIQSTGELKQRKKDAASRY